MSSIAGDDPRSDEQLVADGNRGDVSALEAIYLRYRAWACSLAVRFTGDPELAADAAQEAFIYLMGKFPGLVLRAKLTTLLYPAVKNSALALTRKRRPQSLADGENELVAHAPAEPGEHGARLAAAVDRLPSGQREVLLMRAVDGMSTSEIAAALGIPEGTVKSRLHHAIRAMREHLGSEFPDAG